MPEPRNTQSRHVSLSLRARIAICLAMLMAGAAILALIFSTEPEARREAAVRESAMLVEVIRPEAGTFRPTLVALGTVMPTREVTLRPQVGGIITEMADAFSPGSVVAAGEVLIRIEDADYRSALSQREAELEQAIAELEIEQGRRDLAQRDYAGLERELDADKRSLVLREPQLRSAQARIQSARAAVDLARLDLERTTVRAPYAAQVLSREVALGSVLDRGDAVARLAGLDTYWVETTLSLDQLAWLDFAGDDPASGSPVTVRHRTAWPEGQVRQGYLLRLIGELEGNTRLARVLVAVDDPLARLPENAGLPPLIIGSYVECRIEGRPIENVVRLPREHLRQDDTAWLARDGRLEIRPVEAVFRDERYAYVGTGLDTDDLVVTTSLATVRDGARLRLKPADAPEAADGAVAQ